MRNIRELDNLEGKRVLLRSSLNVPLSENGEILDDSRIKRALPTIEYLQNKGAYVSVIGHMGRDGTESLDPVVRELAKHVKDFGTNVVLRENLRQDPREVANDDEFARELAGGQDIFVQDAFSVCHREHSSIVGVPKFLPSYAGLLLEEEVRALGMARNPESPSLAIIGGAKFETKEPLIRELVNKYDMVHVTGALANEFWKAKGLEIGLSKIEDGAVPEDLLNNERVVLPDFVTVQNILGQIEKKYPHEVSGDEKIADARMPEGLADNKSTTLWNGPAGYYEGGFTQYTHDIAYTLAESGANIYSGGGDTVAAVKELGVLSKFTHVSTGGGAMLEFLLHGNLPGIDALRQVQGKS